LTAIIGCDLLAVLPAEDGRRRRPLPRRALNCIPLCERELGGGVTACDAG